MENLQSICTLELGMKTKLTFTKQYNVKMGA